MAVDERNIRDEEGPLLNLLISITQVSYQTGARKRLYLMVCNYLVLSLAVKVTVLHTLPFLFATEYKVRT